MNNKVYTVICGSNLYGTNLPTSDIDIGEVLVEPKDMLFGVDNVQHLAQKVSDKEDVNKHWVRRFAYLCYKGNPNVLEWLYSPKPEFVHHAFENTFLYHKVQFLGLDTLAKSHLGFAKQQIEKMEIYSTERGADRKALVDKYGYDLKYGAHAIRLLWQLDELIRTHDLQFPYSKEMCESLIAIKTGKLTKNEFYGLYTFTLGYVNKTVERNTGMLPKTPDKAKINTLCKDFFERYYYD